MMHLSRTYPLLTALCIFISAHSCQLTSGAEPESARRAHHVDAMRVTVSFLENELQTIKALHARQASSESEVDHVRANLAKARHDLALLETQREREFRMFIQRDLARDRERKDQYLRDGYLDDDLSLSELDL
jgi:multidrug resistance efflux pump